MTSIYVGNLDNRSTEAGVRSAFELYGQVAKVNVVSNCAVVEMPNEAEAQSAMSDLDRCTCWVLRRFPSAA
jgi:RNA recognition motif-containing protein